MPIEFRCDQCGKLLRTGDETAGKQAKCPSCGTVQPIPTPLSSAGPPASPQSGEYVGSPFGAGGAPPLPPPPGGEVNPYQSPASALLGPAESYYAPAPGTRTIRPTRIDVGEVIASTWAIATTNMNQFLMCFVVMLTCVALNWAAGFVQQIILLSLQPPGAPVAVFIAANLVLTILGVLFQFWLTIGQTLYFIRTARGEETPFGLVFSGGPYMVRVILASILIAVVAIGIALVCAIPAVAAYWATQEPMVGVVVFALVVVAPSVYLSLTYYQYQYLIIDCDLDVIGSLQASRQITSGNRLTLFVLYLLAALAIPISLLLCCVPVLFMIPFVMLGTAVTYLKISGQTTVDQWIVQSPTAAQTPEPRPLR